MDHPITNFVTSVKLRKTFSEEFAGLLAALAGVGKRTHAKRRQRSGTMTCRSRWLTSATALFAMVVLCRAAIAQESLIQLRLEGWVGHAPAGRASRGEVQVRVNKEDVNLEVNTVRVLSGESFGPDVLAGLVATRPGLYLYGPPPLLKRFTAAKPETYVALVGYLREGTSDMNASDVTVLPAPKTP